MKPPTSFYANLAKHMGEAELNKISTELLEGIDRDDDPPVLITSR